MVYGIYIDIDIDIDNYIYNNKWRGILIII